MASRGRMPSITRVLGAVGAGAALAAGSMMLPSAAIAAEPDDVFTTTYGGPTPGVLLTVQEGDGLVDWGATPVSFVFWSVVNPTASSVTVTSSIVGRSGIPISVEIPPFTEGYAGSDEFALRAGESVSISVAGLGTISVDRVAAGVDPLGVQTLGDPRAEQFNVFVSGLTAVAAPGGGTDVTFAYRRMATQPMWLEDQGQSHDASVQLRQYSPADVDRQLNAEASPSSLVAQTIALGPVGGGPRTGTVTTHLAASPETARTLSLVQVDAFVTQDPADPTLAQGAFAPAAVVPPAPGNGGTPAGTGGAAGGGAASLALPPVLAASGSDDAVAVGGLIAGGSAVALGIALVVTARRRSTARG